MAQKEISTAFKRTRSASHQFPDAPKKARKLSKADQAKELQANAHMQLAPTDCEEGLEEDEGRLTQAVRLGAKICRL